MINQLRQMKEQLGLLGVLGIVLIGLAAVFHNSVITPLEVEVNYMLSHLGAQQNSGNREGRSFTQENRQKELGAFIKSLPSEHDVTDVLASIYTIAETSRIDIKQADYRLSRTNKNWNEYEVDFPIYGGYPNIKHFMFRILEKHPAIAVDQINIQRENVGDSFVKGELRFTLFLKARK